MRLIPVITELRSDYSNLESLSNPELRKALVDPRNPNLRAHLEGRVLSLGQEGVGVRKEHLPPVSTQQGTECVANAMLNGIMTMDPRLAAVIVKMKSQLISRLTEEKRYDVLRTNQECRSLGLPICEGVSTTVNPIAFSKLFFGGPCFAIRTTPGLDQFSRHATAFIPASPCRRGCAAYELDSLDGTRKDITVQTLIDSLLEVTGVTYDSHLFSLFRQDLDPFRRMISRK